MECTHSWKRIGGPLDTKMKSEVEGSQVKENILHFAHFVVVFFQSCMLGRATFCADHTGSLSEKYFLIVKWPRNKVVLAEKCMQ
ncbi:hypothetical protein PR048_001905 [Dryococelus australis]|uniref:Uncharacterized protein n=1 Tax=Dryococelus australis TaxID=614101 RepID=A0ABQ9IIU9_9NEOP|nr:hypothetical protein PR048_001905 [Dryococelus australis]